MNFYSFPGTNNKLSPALHSEIVKFIREHPMNEFFDKFVPKNPVIQNDH